MKKPRKKSGKDGVVVLNPFDLPDAPPNQTFQRAPETAEEEATRLADFFTRGQTAQSAVNAIIAEALAKQKP